MTEYSITWLRPMSRGSCVANQLTALDYLQHVPAGVFITEPLLQATNLLTASRRSKAGGVDLRFSYFFLGCRLLERW